MRGRGLPGLVVALVGVAVAPVWAEPTVPGMRGYLLGPLDADRFRCCTGIRSLEAGVEGTLRLRRADGTSLGARTFHFGPATCDQESFRQMTGVTLEDGLTVQVVVPTGRAIVHAPVVDNRPGDPANVLGRTREMQPASAAWEGAARSGAFRAPVTIPASRARRPACGARRCAPPVPRRRPPAPS